MLNGGIALTNLRDTQRAALLREAIQQLQAAAATLSELRDDPRVLIVLPQLEGMSQGWFHGSPDSPDYLVDLLIDLLLEAEGTPVLDHWRGHAMTWSEAEALIG